MHATSAFYRDAPGLEDFEWAEIGPVDGLDVIHPQCHVGTDTIALAAAGAHTVGLDFSAEALAGAARFAAEAGVADRCTWIEGDVHDAVMLVDRSFDLVYTGKGALCWLPDMDRWAAVMWALCRPGGRLYLSEFHPIQDILADDEAVFERGYFPVGGQVFDAPGSYVDRDAETAHNVVVDFVHPMSEVVQALLDVGFVLRSFHEHSFTLYPRWPWLREKRPGVWVMPDGRPDLPLLYSLLLDRPL